MREIVKMFDKGNVCVTGLRGCGKDMLMANVVCRRKMPYVSNVVYDLQHHIPFVPFRFNAGQNTYDEFIKGDVYRYVYPYADGTDVYISDVGVYFPSQYCNELNKKYGYFSTFMALSRHLGECNVHINVQNLNRAWDKLREQSDLYITCNWCKVFKGIVVQMVTLYDKYQSCVDRVPPYSVPRPIIGSPERIQMWKLHKQNYDCTYGKVRRRLLIYRNLSKYNTRIFKEVLANGKIKEIRH